MQREFDASSFDHPWNQKVAILYSRGRLHIFGAMIYFCHRVTSQGLRQIAQKEDRVRQGGEAACIDSLHLLY
jgi:hypothetical protein